MSMSWQYVPVLYDDHGTGTQSQDHADTTPLPVAHVALPVVLLPLQVPCAAPPSRAPCAW